MRSRSVKLVLRVPEGFALELSRLIESNDMDRLRKSRVLRRNELHGPVEGGRSLPPDNDLLIAKRKRRLMSI